VEIQEIRPLYTDHPHIHAVMSLLGNSNRQDILLSGLNGSSKAVIVASLFEQKGGLFLCLQNDLENAGYFYHDLMQ